MSYLEQLFTHYGTDKGTWGYTSAYEQHLGGHRLRVKSVLEIGICGHRDIPNNVVGASLFAWRDYFPEARVYGIDNDGKFVFNDKPRIITALANAYDTQALHVALASMVSTDFDGFDFVCDDAVHDPLPQVDLCRMLWPLVKRGGIYAIEDVCPYKCHDNKLDSMCAILVAMFPEMKIDEYRTHKEERLLVLTKAA